VRENMRDFYFLERCTILDKGVLLTNGELGPLDTEFASTCALLRSGNLTLPELLEIREYHCNIMKRKEILQYLHNRNPELANLDKYEYEGKQTV
jgi:hypothetical protein